jgi:predicted kinase
MVSFGSPAWSIQENGTMLILLSGLPGTGKSTIAEGIGRARQIPVFSVDPIESAVIEAGIAASFETGLAAYLIAETLADRSLAAGLDAVIDAVNSVEQARDMWRGLAAKHSVEIRIIECVVSDEVVHRARVASRRRGLALAEPGWDDVERRRAEWTTWPEPHLTLDGLDPPGENLAKALDYVVGPPRRLSIDE